MVELIATALALSAWTVAIVFAYAVGGPVPMLVTVLVGLGCHLAIEVALWWRRTATP